jgi:hypothetical protein
VCPQQQAFDAFAVVPGGTSSITDCTLAALGLFDDTAAALSSRWLPPARVIDVLFISPGIGLPALLVVADYRYRRELRPGEQSFPRLGPTLNRITRHLMTTPGLQSR